jgi:hypothetical protein
MYLVVPRMKIKFSKELGSTQFIQEVINDMNGKFVFNGEFVEAVEVRTHALRGHQCRFLPGVGLSIANGEMQRFPSVVFGQQYSLPGHSLLCFVRRQPSLEFTRIFLKILGVISHLERLGV